MRLKQHVMAGIRFTLELLDNEKNIHCIHIGFSSSHRPNDKTGQDEIDSSIAGPLGEGLDRIRTF